MRIRAGGEVTRPNWEATLSEDLLGRWGLNLMLINVSTRKFGRAVRLPEGDMAAADGNEGEASRRDRAMFVALSEERAKG